ncbi:acetoin reductase family protein [Pterulicium gracile]|uniref:Acetoin reductase family protein n=1 Tax=Pterulicium gracile TaxID=1884261 RepID=A0A5C3Q4V6_9AGAR|nr:acetoin reductase family protein [Pterula gracilis]TFK95228.1 acetoin reductase family protein [Pterula gracilis]
MSTQTTSTKGAALITGAAQGIGKAIALRLAADGFNVAVNDLSSNSENLEKVAEEIRAVGVKALTVYADVSVEAEVEKMVGAVVEEFGALNVVVANAGIMMWKSIDDLTAEEWDRVMSINLRSVFLAYKYGGRAMIAKGIKGKLIAACSVAGKIGKGMLASYTASKFAIRGLTQSAAQEYGRHGITVNGYAPGVIETPMLTYMDARFGETVPGGKTGDFIKFAEAQSLLGGGNGEVADIAGLVSYLASTEAKFITGQTINVNGGTFFD